jgi:O-acetyl-ADP-ribose deacetylase (regulator of RNase III)
VDEPVSGPGVRRGLHNGIRRLAEWGISRVAMPPLGTGAGNLDPDESAAIMIPLLAHALRAGALDEVDIHVDSDYERTVFDSYIRRTG